MPKRSLTALLTEVRACRLCAEHLEAGPRPVVQIGSKARILIAGQAPGRAVHESGVPFDDPSGDRLREWMGVTPETFYDSDRVAILPMGVCFPGTGTSGDLRPRSECPPAWRQSLLDEMPNLALTLIIGQYAMAWHLPGDKETVTKTVGRWREFGPGVLPLPHPSPRNNRWLKNNPWFAAELLPELRVRVERALA